MNVVNKNLLIGIVVIILLVLGFKYFTKEQPTEVVVESEPTNEMTVAISEQNESGETGTAKFIEQDGMVTVTLTMLGSPAEVPQPAHIHVGACPDVGAVAYPLENVVNGVSVTTIESTLAMLTSEAPLAINVHKSAAETSVYTACGDL